MKRDHVRYGAHRPPSPRVHLRLNSPPNSFAHQPRAMAMAIRIPQRIVRATPYLMDARAAVGRTCLSPLSLPSSPLCVRCGRRGYLFRGTYTNGSARCTLSAISAALSPLAVRVARVRIAIAGAGGAARVQAAHRWGREKRRGRGPFFLASKSRGASDTGGYARARPRGMACARGAGLALRMRVGGYNVVMRACACCLMSTSGEEAGGYDGGSALAFRGTIVSLQIDTMRMGGGGSAGVRVRREVCTRARRLEPHAGGGAEPRGGGAHKAPPVRSLPDLVCLLTSTGLWARACRRFHGGQGAHTCGGVIPNRLNNRVSLSPCSRWLERTQLGTSSVSLGNVWSGGGECAIGERERMEMDAELCRVYPALSLVTLRAAACLFIGESLQKLKH
ncbi:hypothetical protein B0H13DRAFT_2275228 [Mycena leptocephala]|nr:hypothetical protein B0H13DRAFT_2275228 [Mycena leptocephala]